MVVLSSRDNGFSTFHLSFLLLLSSAGILAYVLVRDGLANDSNLFNKSIMSDELNHELMPNKLLRNLQKF